MFELRDLQFRYPKNNADTLRGLDFAVGHGEVFGLLGPSGVGKSTTQKILTKLLTGYRGQVQYQGRDLNSYGRDFYEDIGVGFEMPVHFSKLTAMENLQFFARLYRRHTEPNELLKKVGLYEDRDKPVGQFSKGMKVRLNFMRALLNQPKFLFLDEPTNGLDPMNARIIKNMIKDFQAQGGTILLTTHLMSDVDELCDRVAFMNAGRIAEIDSPKNLKLKHGSRAVEVEYEANSGTTVETFDLDGLKDNQQFLAIVQERRIITIHSKETTLEDIFIKLTGVSAHE